MNKQPTTEELVKLRDHLEEALHFKRETQRFRRAHNLHNAWIDEKISDSIKMEGLRLACLDQLIAEDQS